MAKNDPEQVVAGAGLLTAIFTKLNTAVARKGGQPGALHRLSTPDGDTLIEQFADLIVGKDSSDIIELPVNYNEFRTIRRDNYVVLGDVTMNDVPETETGIKLVRFLELEFDHNPSDQEILEETKRKKGRQPTRAEGETYIRRFTPEQLREHPRAGLIGPEVRRLGNLNRVCVVGRVDGVNLYWSWTERRWGRHCRFVVVCK